MSFDDWNESFQFCGQFRPKLTIFLGESDSLWNILAIFEPKLVIFACRLMIIKNQAVKSSILGPILTKIDYFLRLIWPQMAFIEHFGTKIGHIWWRLMIITNQAVKVSIFGSISDQIRSFVLANSTENGIVWPFLVPKFGRTDNGNEWNGGALIVSALLTGIDGIFWYLADPFSGEWPISKSRVSPNPITLIIQLYGQIQIIGRINRFSTEGCNLKIGTFLTGCRWCFVS